MRTKLQNYLHIFKSFQIYDPTPNGNIDLLPPPISYPNLVPSLIYPTLHCRDQPSPLLPYHPYHTLTFPPYPRLPYHTISSHPILSHLYTTYPHPALACPIFPFHTLSHHSPLFLSLSLFSLFLSHSLSLSLSLLESCSETHLLNIGITHVFSCIYICRVPRKLFEHKAVRLSVQTSSAGPGKC